MSKCAVVLSVVLLFGSAIAALPQQVHAWTNNQANCQFANATIRMYDAQFFFTVYEWGQVVSHASSSWANASDVNTTVGGTGYPASQITYWRKVDTTQYEGRTTYPGCFNGSYTGAVTIWLSNHQDSGLFKGDLGYDRSVSVHELGHSIGLGHNGGGSCSDPIMQTGTYGYYICGFTTPQADDINGANAKY